MGLFGRKKEEDKKDLIDFIFALPGVNVPQQVKDTVNTVVKPALKDQDVCRDLDIILTEAVGPFQQAGQSPAADGSLRAIFNDVAKVLPIFSEYVATHHVSPLKTAMAGPAFKRLLDDDNQNRLEKAFNDKNPAVTGLIDSLLANERAQDALGRILEKPAGQGLFILTKEEGDPQGYAIEQLSGGSIKIPVPDATYNKFKPIVDAAKNNPPRFG